MEDQGNRDTQTNGGTDVQTNTPIGVSLIAAKKPESVSNSEESKPKKKGHYGEYVIWFLIPVGFLVFLRWNFTRELLDKHNGAVSAIGTIAIMLLTIAYVRYSRHQWQVMDGQLEQMRQQLPEIQKSAKAAQDSADIATDAQRSWFLVKGIKEPEMSGIWIESFTYVFEIIGSSPVRVMESKLIFRLVEGRPCKHNPKTMEPDLPETPVYGEPNTLDVIPTMGMILAPGEGPHVTVRLEDLFIKEEQMEELKTWKKFACSWGFVRYRDAFAKAKIRETRFCYVYDIPQGLIPSDRTKEKPNAFRVGGPPEYTDVT